MIKLSGITYPDVTIKAFFNSPEAGFPHHIEAGKSLELGKFYEVSIINMGQSYTSVKLADFPDLVFTSTQFKFFENGNEINIFRDPRFNPYMRR